MISDCFVTGKWEAAKDAENLLKMDEEDDEEFGDFEDLEAPDADSSNKDETKSAGKFGYSAIIFNVLMLLL